MAYVPDAERGRDLALVPLDSRVRALTRLDRFAVRGASERLVLIAKTYRSGGEPEPDRPRLVPWLPPGSRASLEHRALAAIADVTARDRSGRLGAIRVLDLLDEETVVMAELDWPSLDRLLLRQRLRPERHGRAGGIAEAAFPHAGYWLTRFRDLPIATEGTLLATRDQQIEALVMLGEWLGRRTGSPSAAQLERVHAAAEAVLPPALATAPGHGDFAMRNLLVGPEGQVAAIDTRARWRVPIELDLATLLVAIATNRLQAVTGGRAWSGAARARYERALLGGAAYEDDLVPRLRVFELLVLWDAWAALRARTGAGRRGWRRHLVAWPKEHRFRTHGDALIREIGESGRPFTA